MKYFSLSEILIGIPASLILGLIFALFHSFISALISGTVDCIRTIKTKTKKLFSSEKKIKSPKQSIKLKNKAAFIINEILNCFIMIIFALIFTVFVYIISDGIPRIYILAITVISFLFISRLFKKPLDLLCRFLSHFVAKIFLFALAVITYIPLKIIKKCIKNKKRTVKVNKNGNFV